MKLLKYVTWGLLGWLNGFLFSWPQIKRNWKLLKFRGFFVKIMNNEKVLTMHFMHRYIFASFSCILTHLNRLNDSFLILLRVKFFLLNSVCLINWSLLLLLIQVANLFSIYYLWWQLCCSFSLHTRCTHSYKEKKMSFLDLYTLSEWHFQIDYNHY